MYRVISCIKDNLKEAIEEINKENYSITTVLEYNQDWYDIIVRESERVMY